MMLKQISLYPFVSTIATNNKIVSCLTMFTRILICSYICSTFKYLVEPKKMRLATKTQICPISSPWTPIWDHFVKYWMMSAHKQPTLTLKSGLVRFGAGFAAQKNRKLSKPPFGGRFAAPKKYFAKLGFPWVANPALNRTKPALNRH